MTEEEALAKYNSKWWESASYLEIVQFQLYEERLCMPFDIFQLAVEKVLGRPVWTHEFANADRLKAQFERRTK